MFTDTHIKNQEAVALLRRAWQVARSADVKHAKFCTTCVPSTKQTPARSCEEHARLCAATYDAKSAHHQEWLRTTSVSSIGLDRPRALIHMERDVDAIAKEAAERAYPSCALYRPALDAALAEIGEAPPAKKSTAMGYYCTRHTPAEAAREIARIRRVDARIGYTTTL